MKHEGQGFGDAQGRRQPQRRNDVVPHDSSFHQQAVRRQHGRVELLRTLQQFIVIDAGLPNRFETGPAQPAREPAETGIAKEPDVFSIVRERMARFEAFRREFASNACQRIGKGNTFTFLQFSRSSDKPIHSLIRPPRAEPQQQFAISIFVRGLDAAHATPIYHWSRSLLCSWSGQTQRSLFGSRANQAIELALLAGRQSHCDLVVVRNRIREDARPTCWSEEINALLQSKIRSSGRPGKNDVLTGLGNFQDRRKAHAGVSRFVNGLNLTGREGAVIDRYFVNLALEWRNELARRTCADGCANSNRSVPRKNARGVSCFDLQGSIKV